MKKTSLLSQDQEISPTLSAQLKTFDLNYLQKLSDEYVLNKPTFSTPQDIQPVKTFSRTPQKKDVEVYEKAYQLGRQLVRQGKVGAFLVAGGQGTRLGFEGPKGEFCVTPIKHKTLFQVFAEQLLAHSQENGRTIPWYIMTSPINNTETKAFFENHNYFGYDKDNIFFFEQGMMPAFSMEDGSLLLSNKDSLALSPDGHGGSLRALKHSGALDDMRRRGIEYLSYFQVDNPIVHCIDYTFIGLHVLTQSEMSSKVVAKAKALEKVGNFVLADGKVQVIEYSDIPKELAEQTNDEGALKFNAGSIAIHALSVSFIERLTASGQLNLPWHRAEKKVAYLNKEGNLVKPETPNAVKLEQFIFDAIPLANNALVYETERNEEFSPVKNAEGSDSPNSCREYQIARAARWLREAGISVSNHNVVLEIDPLFATSSEQFREKVQMLNLSSIQEGAVLYFGPQGIEDLTPAPFPVSIGQRFAYGFRSLFGKARDEVAKVPAAATAAMASVTEPSSSSQARPA